MDALAPGMTAPEPGTARWWLARLDDELSQRVPQMDAFRALVDDEHELPQMVERSAKFQRMAGLSTTNLTGLAVEATAERMNVEGVRIGNEPNADLDFWDEVWQRSEFDNGSQEAITAALVYGRSFLSVSPPTADAGARMHYEDPRQVVLAHAPDGTKAAALKVFTDEWTGDTFGTLYTPGYVVRMIRTGNPHDPHTWRWVARDLGRVDAVAANPLREVPFFELQNRPLGSLRSEVASLVIPQKRLNHLVYNMDAVGEYGAFRQKWATGIEVPRDPATGAPMSPYDANIASLFVAEGSDAKFGDFGATDLAGYIELGREIAAHISRLSRVPITYFLSNISNLGGDALALLISGLVLKCQRRVKGYEPALEGACRLALAATNDPRATTANIEIKWAEMETRSMAQSADAALKLTSGDHPVITPQTAQERFLGMSQTERNRDDAWRQEGHSANDLDAILAAAQASALPAVRVEPTAAPVTFERDV